MNELFAPFYEGWGLFYLDQFSDDLFNFNLYMPIGLTLIISTVALLVVYYYIIDHPKFAKWIHWFLWILLICGINFCVAYYVTYNELDVVYAQKEQAMPYSVEFFSFSVVNAFWTFLFGLLTSALIKWKSINCKRTPF